MGQVTGTNSIAVLGVGGSGNSGSLGTANAGVEGTGTIKGVKGAVTDPVGGVGVEGTNPSGTTGQLGKRNYGVWGSATSGAGVHGEGPIGVEGTATGTNYAGYFTGGNGLYASKIAFGPDAFSASGNTGSLILGAKNVISCTTVCVNHGLPCNRAVLLSGSIPAYGCSAPPAGADRYCWCGTP